MYVIRNDLATSTWNFNSLFHFLSFPDETCCPGPSSSTYGCCPAPNAVCCSDHLHCCPQNTVCDLTTGQCVDKKQQLIPFAFRKREPPTIVKAAAVEEAQRVEVVYCPGGTSYCADGSTCCILSTGQYGCCPYPSATCCNDRIHCCPSGTRCDSTSQYCLQANTQMRVAPKRPRTPAFPVL